MQSAATKEHQWLQQLVGTWRSIMEYEGAELIGSEVVRTIGDLWIVTEGTLQMPGGGTSSTQMTLGYDTVLRKYVGSFVDSMTGFQWIYEGELDATGRILPLNTKGPRFEQQGTEFTRAAGLQNYRDTLELTEDGGRLMRSEIQSDEGVWSDIMSMRFERVG